MNEKDIIDTKIENYACVILTGTCLASEPSRSATFLAMKFKFSFKNKLFYYALFGSISLGAILLLVVL